MTRGNTDTERKEIQIVCFKLSGREYGFPILQVKEIVRLGNVIKLPELSRVFEGVINLRGQLVPLLDLRVRYGVPTSEEIIPKALILKISNEDFLGAIVDDISEIIILSESKFLSITSSVIDKESRKISGIVEMEGDRSIIILDVSNIMDEKELARIKEKIEATGAEHGTEHNGISGVTV